MATTIPAVKSAPRAAGTVRAGAVVGRYRLTKALGAGGVGEVFLAEDSALARSVAVNVSIRRSGEADRGQLGLTRAGAARILREARVAATLDHPNAVSVFDADEADGVPYLVMELVSGRTLREMVGQPSVTTEQKIGWLIDIARALAAAHAKRIVHQDIKPENVMLRDDGVIKVLDFGIARRIADDEDPEGGRSELDERLWNSRVHGAGAHAGRSGGRARRPRRAERHTQGDGVTKHSRRARPRDAAGDHSAGRSPTECARGAYKRRSFEGGR